MPMTHRAKDRKRFVDVAVAAVCGENCVVAHGIRCYVAVAEGLQIQGNQLVCDSSLGLTSKYSCAVPMSRARARLLMSVLYAYKSGTAPACSIALNSCKTFPV